MPNPKPYRNKALIHTETETETDTETQLLRASICKSPEWDFHKNFSKYSIYKQMKNWHKHKLNDFLGQNAQNKWMFENLINDYEVIICLIFTNSSYKHTTNLIKNVFVSNWILYGASIYRIYYLWIKLSGQNNLRDKN